MDANSPYQQFRINKLIIDLRQNWIRIGGVFGNTDGGVWTPGIASAQTHLEFSILGADYAAIIQSTPNEGESLYDGVARSLYEHIQPLDARLAGTLV